MEKEQTQAPGAGLIYGLNDRPPVKETIFAALQHLLAIFVAIITPPLIIAGGTTGIPRQQTMCWRTDCIQ